ncbi:hypothetical protein LBMAG56_46880 [Verrucomicrobiota bacterium]|nr:hypothetical protein LBMAG56_46880 [Verrucomicrobiota bacterium]
MNKSHKQILLPVHFAPAAAAIRLVVQAGPIRSHGTLPLLRKSVPAQMAAAAAQNPGR